MVFRVYFDLCLLSLFHNSFCHEYWYCISDLGGRDFHIRCYE
ncbi:mCG1041123 [Mus musculus]|nr:mCG1041123 [Mus musculus]